MINKKYCRKMLFGLLMFSPIILQAEIKEYSGTIFLDKNGNGIQDKGENGVKGIPVSNGRDIVLSDRNGHFQLQGDHNTSIFPILPAEYTLTDKPGKKNNFEYYYCGKENQPTTGLNYPIQKQKPQNRFCLAAVGDPQVGSEQEVDYAAKSVYGELLNHPEYATKILLGDIVHEKMELFDESKQLIERLPGTVLVVPGNHDRYYEATRNNQDSIFNTYFGASNYAFNQGNVHFILLNNVYPTKKRGYDMKYTSKQLEFVRNDLKLVPKNKLIIIAQHIPIISGSNSDSLLNMLTEYPHVLFLSGHTHNVRRNLIKQGNRTIQEIVAGASCGHFWRGELDWEGIPSAVMNGGSPRCYFIIDIDRNQYKFRYKAIGRDSNSQMNIWVNSPLPQGKPDKRRDPKVRADTLIHIDSYQPDAIVATIYGACDQTQVRVSIDGGEWHTMNHVKAIAPTVARINQLASGFGLPSDYSTPLKLRNIPSPLVWVYNPEKGLKKGQVHTITIEAEDRYGFSVKESRLITK
jgi:Predicted phosphohydrolases